MRLSCSVFEILSLIFQNLKRSRDSDHSSFRINLSSVGWDLLYQTHISNLKCLRLPCNKEMKGNDKCKNSRFEPPFVDLGVTHRVHLSLDGKRIVDFLLAIIELFR